MPECVESLTDSRRKALVARKYYLVIAEVVAPEGVGSPRDALRDCRCAERRRLRVVTASYIGSCTAPLDRALGLARDLQELR